MKTVDVSKSFRKLPYAVVDLAISQGWTRELAYYLHITSSFGNGVVYNYSTRTLADKLGVSKSVINKTVNFLLESGMMRMQGDNLVGVSLKKLNDWYFDQTGEKCGKGYITIKLQDNIKHTEWNILARVPLNGINQQKYMSGKRAEVNAIRAKLSKGSYITSSEFKKWKSTKDSFETKITENASKSFTTDINYMSDKYIAERTGKSVSTVRSMIKFWVSQGLVSTNFHKGVVLDNRFSARSYEAIKTERPTEFSQTYLYKGRIITYNKRSISYGSSTRVYKERFSI